MRELYEEPVKVLPESLIAGDFPSASRASLVLHVARSLNGVPFLGCGGTVLSALTQKRAPFQVVRCGRADAGSELPATPNVIAVAIVRVRNFIRVPTTPRLDRH